jgi:LmbE family N-acetylglucosaminyl deacetylase
MGFWETKQKILVILAHPDDPEFSCGGTVAKWTSEGHNVSYCLLTKGDKGVNDHFSQVENIKELRIEEQQNAAKVIGVNDIIFLDNEDGYLTPNMELRKVVTGVIRKVKPDIVVTCDPTNYYMRDSYINHPDHRAAGQVVIDAVFPAAQNFLFFPELMTEMHLEPHHVKEVWITNPKEQNIAIDVTDTWPRKLEALTKHASQIGDVDQFYIRMRSRRTEDSSDEAPRYEEVFRRIVFR